MFRNITKTPTDQPLVHPLEPINASIEQYNNTNYAAQKPMCMLPFADRANKCASTG